MLDITIVSDAVEGTFVERGWAKTFRMSRRERHQREWKRSKGAGPTEMRKEEKRFEVRIVKWFGPEYRKEVHEKIQRHFRYLLWNRAQIEEGGNGGIVQQRGQGTLEVCN